jgi:hypothetical protein
LSKLVLYSSQETLNLGGLRDQNAPVVVLTTSETTTSGMLAVLSYTTVTGGDVAAVLAGLREAGRHGVCRERNDQNQPQSISTLHPDPPGPIQPRIRHFEPKNLENAIWTVPATTRPGFWSSRGTH